MCVCVSVSAMPNVQKRRMMRGLKTVVGSKVCIEEAAHGEAGVQEPHSKECINEVMVPKVHHRACHENRSNSCRVKPLFVGVKRVRECVYGGG